MRVRAHNTAADSENKIHDNRVAAAYGFRGGLVPGVTVYGYMIPAVVERMGRAWLSRGAMSVRFVAPFYEDDWVVTSCDGEVARAEREDGTLCASGAVSIGANAPSAYAEHPLPDMDARPPVTSLTAGMPLGTMVQALDVADAAGVPEALLWMANQILVRNFQMGPWIHVSSDVEYHRLAACGEQITVTGEIAECFERKGRKFAVAMLAMSGAASVRHTFIYGLEPDIIPES